MTAEDFVSELNDSGEQKNFKLATVVNLFDNNTAKIQFDGEDTPSEKEYAYLDSYKPRVEDKVLLGVLGGTYVILGKVNYQVAPSSEEEVDRYLFDLKKVIMQKGLNVTGGLETDTLISSNGATVVGNVGVNGSVTATGISSSGKVSGASVSSSGALTGGATDVSSLNVTGDADVGGRMTASGQVRGQSLYTTGSLNAGTSTLQSLSVSGSSSLSSFTSSGAGSVTGSFTMGSNLAHKGANIGFFGKSPLSRPTGSSYSTLSTSATLLDVISKLNTYIELLKRYGLSY